MKKIMIVIPAYNESSRVGRVVKSIPKQLKIKDQQFKVVVVVIDDCSRDGTAMEAEKAGAITLRHVMNSGAGAATRTGLKYADYVNKDLAYVVTIDADGQHATADVKKLITYAVTHNSSMIVGNRLHGANKQAMPLHRIVGNKGLSLISRILFGVRTEDTQSGLRLFSAHVIPVVADFTIDRYGFCTEMLWLAHKAKLRIDEVPISVTYSQETMNKGQNNWGVVELLKDLLWIRISN